MDRTCHRTSLALPWLLNDSLAADERRAVREHLIACPACRAELVRTREMLAMAQAAPAVPQAAVRTHVLSRPRLAMAAAAVLAVILAGSSLWMGVRPHSELAATRLPARTFAIKANVAPSAMAPSATVVAANGAPAVDAQALPHTSAIVGEIARPPRVSHRRPVASTRTIVATRVTAATIYRTSFEDGGVASTRLQPEATIAAADSSISSFDFESGRTAQR